MIAATALAAREKGTGALSCSQFDMIGGTSVGFLIGSALACGIPAEGVVNFFNTEAPKIFQASLWRNLTRLTAAAKYDPTALKDALTRMLGTRTLADCKVPLMGTAVDMKSGRNTYFQSHTKSSEDDTEIVLGFDCGISLVDLALASSAAQSYFPGHAVGPYLFWDGGTTGCNAPDMLLLTEALELGNAMAKISMLSLGAGTTDWKYTNENLTNPSLPVVVEATIEAVYSCGETNAVWQARSLLQGAGGQHRRISPYLFNYAIDDASEMTLTELAKAASIDPI